MKIEIDLNYLKENNLSPTEYVVLYLINKGLNDFQNTQILESLERKGFLKDGLVVSIEPVKLNCKEWIDKWLDLWPTLITPQNYRISGNKTEVINRMNKFIKEYDYSPDVIFEATKKYLNRKKAENYNFTKKNTKFIKDTDGSILEQECNAIINGEKKEITNTKFL
jgi:hypothetical protein